MSLSKLFTVLAALSVLVISAGCSDDGATGQSSFNIAAANTALGKPVAGNSAPATPLTFSDGTYTFTITEARLNVRDFGFDPSTGATSSTEKVEVTGPFVFDVYNNTAQPAIPAFDLPAGNYQRLDIRFDDADAADGVLANGDALLNNSMLIKGTYTDGINNGAFSIALKFNEDLRLEPVGGIVVDTDTTVDVMMNIRVTDWLKDAAGNPINIASCITGFTPGDDITLTDDGSVDCTVTGGTDKLENVIKYNIKNKYDFSS